MSNDLKRAVTGLISKAAKGDIDYNSIASMRIADLKQYGVKPDDVIAIVERQTKRTLTADEKRKIGAMSVEAVVNGEEQREQNRKLEALADAEAKTRKEAADAAKGVKAA